MKKSLLHILLFVLVPIVAQQRVADYNRYVSVMPAYGKVQIHSRHVNNLLGAYPRGLEIDFGRHYFHSSAKQTYGCYPRSGFSFTVWDFNSDVLGYGLSGMFYFEPFLFASNRFMCSLKGGIGIILLTDPYDAEDHPQNLAYSLPVSFPLSVGLNVYVPLSYKWSLKGSGYLSHFSNGGIKQPNYGVNYPVLSFGVEYALDRYRVPPREHSQMLRVDPGMRRHWIETVAGIGSKDVSGTGIENTQFILYFHSRYIHQWTRINGWSAGGLFEFENPVATPQGFLFSPLLGHVFMLGDFIFSQEIGYSFVMAGDAYHRMMQLYALQYHFFQRWVVGFNLKAQANVADYVGLRFGYSW
ncbi:MAG: acyloxyacyl hydrolase [Marinilabiliaceae bacterium]|nr:acyloxyacyl hydrolase [Marinilabiliaceae bacterium]